MVKVHVRVSQSPGTKGNCVGREAGMGGESLRDPYQGTSQTFLSAP